jgi:hypothetical protein
MNQYYQVWLEHQEQLQMPVIPTSDANSEGPYWTLERAQNIHIAGRHTRSAFTMASAMAAVDGPLPFMDVASFSVAGLYSAAWWFYALS